MKFLKSNGHRFALNFGNLENNYDLKLGLDDLSNVAMVNHQAGQRPRETPAAEQHRNTKLYNLENIKKSKIYRKPRYAMVGMRILTRKSFDANLQQRSRQQRQHVPRLAGRWMGTRQI